MTTSAGERFALRVTDAGLRAIDAETAEAAQSGPHARGARTEARQHGGRDRPRGGGLLQADHRDQQPGSQGLSAPPGQQPDSD